jgi:hypothetical protein
MNQFLAAIEKHRLLRGISMVIFARDELKVPYFVAYDALKRGTTPADYNRKPFKDYYRAHEAEITALMAGDAAELAAPSPEVTP